MPPNPHHTYSAGLTTDPQPGSSVACEWVSLSVSLTLKSTQQMPRYDAHCRQADIVFTFRAAPEHARRDCFDSSLEKSKAFEFLCASFALNQHTDVTMLQGCCSSGSNVQQPIPTTAPCHYCDWAWGPPSIILKAHSWLVQCGQYFVRQLCRLTQQDRHKAAVRPRLALLLPQGGCGPFAHGSLLGRNPSLGHCTQPMWAWGACSLLCSRAARHSPAPAPGRSSRQQLNCGWRGENLNSNLFSAYNGHSVAQWLSLGVVHQLELQLLCRVANASRAKQHS